MTIIKVGSRLRWKTPSLQEVHDFNIRIRPRAKVKIRFGMKDEFFMVRKYRCLGPDYIDHYGRIEEDIVFNIKTGQLDIKKNDFVKRRETNECHKVGHKKYLQKMKEFQLLLDYIIASSLSSGLKKGDPDIYLARQISNDIIKGLFENEE